MDARDCDKEEFLSLRAESQFHQVNASAVFGLNVTGLGIGVAAASTNSPVALPIVALLTSILWVRYLDHLIAIFRVAAYVTGVLGPRLRSELSDQGLFGWEEFLRSADTEDTTRWERFERLICWRGFSLPRGSTIDTRRLPPLGLDSRRGIGVATLAFALPPPVLILWYGGYHLATTPLPGVERALSITLAAVGLIAWYLALVRTKHMAHQITSIDKHVEKAIREHEEAMREESRRAKPEPTTAAERDRPNPDGAVGTGDHDEAPPGRP